ncbi:MAG: phosphopantetheine-binding protein [Actinomycetota bacterium]
MDITLNVSDQVREFLLEEVLFEEENVSLDDGTRLLEGVLDSLALMQLVAFLEDEFEVEIEDADITKDNFSTIADIRSLVLERLGQR